MHNIVSTGEEKLSTFLLWRIYASRRQRGLVDVFSLLQQFLTFFR